MNLKMGGLTIDKKGLLYIVGVLIILGILAYFLFSGRGSNVLDNSDGAGQAESDIRSVEQQQSGAIGQLGDIESGLGDGAESTGRISGEVGEVETGINDTSNTINDAQNRVNASQGIATDSASLIAEGKRILATVQARGKRTD